MTTVHRILGVDDRATPSGSRYKITTAILSDGTEAEGWSDSYAVGNRVEVYFHYERIKFRHYQAKRTIDKTIDKAYTEGHG